MLLLQQTTCTSFYVRLCNKTNDTHTEKVQQYREKTHRLTVSLLGSSSFRILKKFLPNCLNPLMKRFCKFFIEEERKRKKRPSYYLWSQLNPTAQSYWLAPRQKNTLFSFCSSVVAEVWCVSLNLCCRLNLGENTAMSGRNKRGNDKWGRERRWDKVRLLRCKENTIS